MNGWTSGSCEVFAPSPTDISLVKEQRKGIQPPPDPGKQCCLICGNQGERGSGNWKGPLSYSWEPWASASSSVNAGMGGRMYRAPRLCQHPLGESPHPRPRSSPTSL